MSVAWVTWQANCLLLPGNMVVASSPHGGERVQDEKRHFSSNATMIPFPRWEVVQLRAGAKLWTRELSLKKSTGIFTYPHQTVMDRSKGDG
jgi:hypothetical protein